MQLIRGLKTKITINDDLEKSCHISWIPSGTHHPLCASTSAAANCHKSYYEPLMQRKKARTALTDVNVCIDPDDGTRTADERRWVQVAQSRENFKPVSKKTWSRGFA